MPPRRFFCMVDDSNLMPVVIGFPFMARIVMLMGLKF
jgi:hypothetical protein